MTQVPAKRAPSPVAMKVKALHEVLMDRSDEIQRVLPETMSAERLIKIGLVAMTQSPALLECSADSILLALMESGSVGLEPNGVLGEAALVPYKKRAQFQPMYRGLVKLAKRSGEVLKLESRLVWEGDTVSPGHFHYDFGLHEKLEHTPNPDPEARGQIAYVYAIAWLRNGLTSFEVMPIGDVEKIRAMSAAQNSPAWKNPTTYGEMAKKTVIKRLCKRLDLSADFQAVYAKDDSVEAGEPLPLSAIDPRFTGPTIGEVAEARTHDRVEALKAELDLREHLEDATQDSPRGEKSRVESESDGPDGYDDPREEKSRVESDFSPYWETEGVPGGFALWASAPDEFWPCRVQDLNAAFDVDEHSLSGSFHSHEEALTIVEEAAEVDAAVEK